jgi:aminomethyltransferase
MNTNLLDVYHHILSGCGIVDVSDRTRLWATGRDRVDLIHRMSTNDLQHMAPGEGRATVLTTAVARMIDRILVIEFGDRALILGSPGTAAALHRWLSSHVFFNDDARFEDATVATGQFLLFGPQAAAVAGALVPEARGLSQYHALEREGLIVGRGEPLAGDSFFVIGARPALEAAWQSALQAGALQAGPQVVEVVRVEAGLPEYGREIGEAFIPLEAGLWDDISFSKGCYIGQEIIARMESRGKLAKTLVGIQSDEPIAAGTASPGGTITSAVQSPRYGWIGLAFVRPSDSEAGTEIQIDGQRMRVAALPFRG